MCCVQFPLDSARFLAFGSADHRIYYYDLRNLKVPLCTLIGHSKTVSYIKFVDNVTLASASTDNTLKLWDLSTCASRVIDSPVQSFTGHMNVKVCSLIRLTLFPQFICYLAEVSFLVAELCGVISFRRLYSHRFRDK